ncbi:SMP-30/gluconolactonase/LRE family protein [Brevundimonas sp.]|jgi:sugar lactone lactonase YvrE|uniref:SMP-30/gluconolactonase/LRE family protein n=1 Tax=Brevundimonas sp. TaxID=1871086 RepID=UPI002E14370D|nr:tetratricopeptide repeat protein [Brevundimonas sp.]
MRLTTLICAVACLTAPAALAQDAEGDVAAFFRLRSEGAAAAQAGDMAAARARLDEADARNPGHPGLTLMRARLAMGEGRTADAVVLVERYAGHGLSFDPAADRTLAPLAGTPALAGAEARLARNREPVGADRLTPLFEVAGSGLTEAVVWDAARNRWLVSQIAGRTILSVDGSGATMPFLGDALNLGGVLGMAWAPGRTRLWAATAPVPPAVADLPAGAAPPAPALLRIDPATGRVLARFDLPGGAEASPGDLAVASDGTVFVSDSARGAVLVLRRGNGEVETLLAPGTLGSPQGIVLSPDGRALVVADYPSGLWRIDVVTGAAIRASAPDDASLIGIDGLVAHDGAILALQNGTAPQRVLRIDLNADWTVIERIEVLVANLPAIDEPTNGVLLDGALVFVARSQWSDFDGEGRPKSPDMAPARVMRLALD